MTWFRVFGPGVLVMISAFIATPLGAQHYQPWRHLNSRNGLPQNSILDLAMDTMGYLWIATNGGLLRYDGSTIRPIDLFGVDGKRHTRLRGLTQTYAHELIVEDVFGGAYMIQGQYTVKNLPAASSTHVRFGDMPSLPIFKRIVCGYPPLQEQDNWWKVPWHIIPLDAHRWVSRGRDRIFLYTDSILTRSVDLQNAADHAFFMLGGMVFFLHHTGHCVRFDPSTGGIEQSGLSGIPIPFPLLRSNFEIFISGTDRILLRANDRLYRLHYGPAGRLAVQLLDITLPKGTAVNNVLYMEEDDILAVGTSTQGLYFYRPRPMRTLRCPDEDPWKDNAFYQQLELGDGSILTARYMQDGVRVGPTGCQWSTPLIPTQASLCFEQDPNGDVIFYAKGRLFRSDPSGHRDTLNHTPLSHCTFKQIGNKLWIADKDSIGYLFAGDAKWTARIGNGLADLRPSVLRADQQGRVWAGSCAGLFVSEDPSGERFRAMPELAGACVRALELLGDDMFIGTYGDGPFVHRNGTLHRLPMDANKTLADVHSFFVDGNATLWMSTNHGLVRTTMAEIDAAVVDSTARPFYAIYKEWAGMASSEFNGGCDPAVILLKNGDLSYPTMDGLVQFSPENMVDAYAKGMVQMERIKVDGVSWKQLEDMIFPSDVQEIVMDFSLPYWGDPANKQLEYRIVGLQERWRPLHDGAQDLRIIRPPPGRYEVVIRKVGAIIRGDTQQARYTFTVQQPFYARWYGIFSLALLFTLLTWSLIKLNNIRLKRRNRWLEESVALQTDELVHANLELRHSMEHQEKLISIISHDVVPPLRFVARVAHSAEELHRTGHSVKDLGDTLEDLSSSTEKLFLNANNLLDWIRTRSRDRNTDLRSIAVHAFVAKALDRIREMTDKQGIELVNHVDPEDTLFTDGDLLGIALNNALLNMQLHAAASRIEVSAIVTGSIYRLVLRDNGIGIPKNVIGAVRNELQGISHHDDKDRSGAAVGLGFVIIAECMWTLGGVASVDSADPGTRIIFDLPFRKAVH